MQFLFDAHIHSNFSSDGKSDITEYIKIAKQKGIDDIGFTEHIDFLQECGSYNYFDFASYLKRINNLKAQGYNVYAGAEIDYISEVKDEIESHLNEYKYDYVIASVHMINRISISDGKIQRFANESELIWFINNYYAEVKKSLYLQGITVLGHIGIYKRQMWQFVMKYENAVNLINQHESEIAQLCVTLGVTVEVNGSACISSYKSPLADERFLREYYIAGGRKTTVGSDAHKSEDLYRGVDECINLLKSIGFKEILTPWNGKTIAII
jgi:histidinol-phosphatase (PHP family)